MKLEKRLERLATDRWARRGLITLLKSAWFGLCLASVALGLQLLLGWSLPLELLLALVLICIALGAITLLRPRPHPEQVARVLDKRFQLNEQLSTAIEVSQRNNTDGVAGYLLNQANTSTTQIQRYISRNRRMPWPELGMVLAMLLLVAGLVLLTDMDSFDLWPRAEAVPQLARPDDVTEQFPPEPFAPPEQSDGNESNVAESNPEPQPGPQSAQDQQSAAILADALRDQSATRPAADALDQGDTTEAARNLRELADQADQLSQQTRDDLAQSLQDAANQIGSSDVELADQLRESGYGLQQGDQQAAQALEDLAGAVEQLGSNTPPPGENGSSQQASNAPQPPDPQQDQGQGDGGGNGGSLPGEQREREQPMDRLDVDGVPLELESDGDGSTSESEADQPPDGSGSGRFERGSGTPSNNSVQTGEDPLRVPPELRDVVQEYFSPSAQE
ncbi:MAG: hypothetical protein HC837_07830 [Chloroflexaceae bacterium]|nr:hypothetical protein [Chloroflexaceae bacterium]